MGFVHMGCQEQGAVVVRSNGRCSDPTNVLLSAGRGAERCVVIPGCSNKEIRSSWSAGAVSGSW